MKHWNKQVLKNWVIKIILIIFKATLIQKTHMHSSLVITLALAVHFSFVDSFPLKTQLIPTELTWKIFLPKSVNVKNHHMGKTLQTSGKSKVITWAQRQ